MKKFLLSALVVAPVLAIGQNKFPQVAPELNRPEPALPKVLTEPSFQTNTPTATFLRKADPSYGVSFIKVGSTFYDLQTNASIAKRIFLHADGSVSVVWTTAPNGNTGYPDRGTGYNHNAGSGFGSPVSTRVEDQRTGWPSIGILPNGKEYVIGHDATDGGFIMATNDSKGSSNWTTGNGFLKYANEQRPIWGRVANNGNNMHLISNFSDSSSPGDPRAITLNGVYAPMTYSRSTDGGQSWDKEHELLPGYDSTRMLSGGGDQYALDVRGDVVAIVTGGLGDDVTLWKSTDNGENFTKILADSFPYAPFSKQLATDTPFTNDGTVAVIIDNNDKVHVFWGLGRVLDNDTSDDQYSFFPATNGIGYWNEVTGTSQVIAGIVDENFNNTLDVQPGTWSALSNGSIPSGVNSVARTGNTSITTMPSAAIDAQGRLFVTYSAPRELDENVDLLNYRDVYLVYSTDGGQTWGNPQNISQAQQKEDAFPSIARNVNNFVHITWQQDDIPGTNLQNNSTSSNNHAVVENDILYAAIPVSKIIGDSIGQGPGVGIFEPKSAEVFTVSQNYPNPFDNETSVIIYLTEPSALTLTVTDMTGREVRNWNLGEFVTGNHEIVIDGEGLSAGIYTYTISTGTHSAGNKMVVK